ncbi:MAG: MFS transporter, partial [Alphaproteobacteria bacterium]|nr:MFS transporter [Alphaproteobacteria bacterium]
ASILCPIFFGYTIELSGSWTIAFSVSIGVLLLGALLAFRIRPDKPFSAADRADVAGASA